ncbi:MAG: SEC-C domain-containing protein [Bacteroidia bacterium]|nr:SEC-C domain-containing protein [Bacteroidia bacterium]
MIDTHNLYISERDQMFGGLEQMIHYLNLEEPIRIPPEPFPDIYSKYNQYLLEWEFYSSERDLEEIELIRNPDLNEMDEDEDDLYDEDDEDDIYDEWSEADSKNDFAPHTIFGTKEPGRNEPCPCGSGKKYKKCCMLN